MAAPKLARTNNQKEITETSEAQTNGLNEVNPFWQSTLFSDVYMRNDVPHKYKDVWEQEESGPFYEFCEQFRNLCEELRGESFESWSERTTINRFIKPVLRLLGWANNCSANQEPWTEDEPITIKESGETKIYKPDFIIVDNPKQLKYIEKKDGEGKLEEARNSSIISIEAKYWGRIDESKYSSREDKDRADKRNGADATRALDFDEQCLKYVDLLHHDYGILTDGRTWRLYHRELSSGSFKRCYQFNLGKLAKHVLAGLDKDAIDYRLFVDNVKYFYHLFSKSSLYNDATGRRFVDDLVSDSRKYTDQVEDDLRQRFVSAMAIACNGFRDSLGKAYSDAQLDLIRSAAESHIFNILFIRYCESRNILPIRQNPEYRKNSLSNVIDKLDLYDPDKDADDLNSPILRRRFKEQFDYNPNGTDLYDMVLVLVEILQNGLPHPAAKFSIAGFKETVFSKAELAFVKKHKLTNQVMSRLLFELTYLESEKPGRFQQIAYSFFAARQLGSIYESFLEFKLDRADCDMAFINHQWKPADIQSDKVKKLRVPTISRGRLFFSPDNELRKATGSYYTPDFVVQYIVENTLGRILVGKRSKEILKIRVCDPAMGSGHFLAGALVFLAKLHLEVLDKETAGDVTLTLAEAKRLVLHHCIHGVDINPRAVKLAKMSLWLETATSNQPLEPLDAQILCGDSITDEFNWKKNFPDAFGAGGFDAIIGNPPYRKERDSKELMEAIKQSRYGELYYEGKMDLWHFFLHRSLDIVKPNHPTGFIVPTYWLKSSGSSKLISRLKTEATFRVAVDFKKNKIFRDVSGQHMVFVVDRNSCESSVQYRTFARNDHGEKSLSLCLQDNGTDGECLKVPQDSIYTEDGFIDFDGEKYSDILSTLDDASFKLEGSEAFFNVSQGIVEAPDRINAEMAKKAGRPELDGKGVFVLTQAEVNALALNSTEKPLLKKYLKGSDVSSFHTKKAKHSVLYIDSKMNKLISSQKAKYPNITSHFKQFDKMITSSNKPYGLHRARESRYFDQEKLFCHNMFDRPSFAYSDEEVYVNFAFNVVVKGNPSKYSLKYLLGILNSSIGRFWFDRKGKKRGINNDVGVGVLREFPVCKVEFTDKHAAKKHDAIVGTVEKLMSTISEHGPNHASTERLRNKLDELVFDLYALNRAMIERITNEFGQTSSKDENEAA